MRKILASLIILMVISLNSLNSPPANAAGGMALLSNPIRVTIAPGGNLSRSFSIQNRTDQSQQVHFAAVPFYVDADYNNIFDLENEFTNLHKWIELGESEITLAPDQTATIDFDIHVPSDWDDNGGQYAGIGISWGASSGDGIAIAQRLIFQIYGKGANTEYAADFLGHSIPFYIEGSSIETTYSIANRGKIDFVARGRIAVKDLFGNTIYESPTDSNSQFMLLPETTAPPIEVAWAGAGPGAYWVTQTVDIPSDTFSQTGFVIVSPMWLLVVTIVTFALILLLIARLLTQYVRRVTVPKRD